MCHSAKVTYVSNYSKIESKRMQEWKKATFSIKDVQYSCVCGSMKTGPSVICVEINAEAQLKFHQSRLNVPLKTGYSEQRAQF